MVGDAKDLKPFRVRLLRCTRAPGRLGREMDAVGGLALAGYLFTPSSHGDNPGNSPVGAGRDAKRRADQWSVGARLDF
ncbi:hypothetical protein Pen01_26730 [Phytomonospora endophytica]|nr:hypothetical protein Pen01_26730 [Phytomonospora endophytica]